MEEGATKGKKSDLSPETVQFGVEMAFASVSAATEHDWWDITETEARQITMPLTRILNRMDPLQRKVFERYFDPIMLLFAVGMVVTPRLKAEIYLREETKRIASTSRRPNVQVVGGGQAEQANGYSGSNAVFRRRDVIEHFRNGDTQPFAPGQGYD